MERATCLKTVILADEELCDECDFGDDGTYFGDDGTYSSTGSRYPKNKDEREFIKKQLLEGISSPVKVLIL